MLNVVGHAFSSSHHNIVVNFGKQDCKEYSYYLTATLSHRTLSRPSMTYPRIFYERCIVWLLHCRITVRWSQKKLWHAGMWSPLWTPACHGLAIAMTSVSLYFFWRSICLHPNIPIHWYIAGTIFVIRSESICSNWPLIQFTFVPVIEQNNTGQQHTCAFREVILAGATTE